jgi:hypothetical protein
MSDTQDRITGARTDLGHLPFALERLRDANRVYEKNHKRTSPRRPSRTTSRRADLIASKMSTGFCSPGNARPWWRW